MLGGSHGALITHESETSRSAGGAAPEVRDAGREGLCSAPGEGALPSYASGEGVKGDPLAPPTVVTMPPSGPCAAAALCACAPPDRPDGWGVLGGGGLELGVVLTCICKSGCAASTGCTLIVEEEAREPAFPGPPTPLSPARGAATRAARVRDCPGGRSRAAVSPGGGLGRGGTCDQSPVGFVQSKVHRQHSYSRAANASGQTSQETVTKGPCSLVYVSLGYVATELLHRSIFFFF